MRNSKTVLSSFYLLLLLSFCICLSCSDDEDINTNSAEMDTEVPQLEDHFPVEDYQSSNGIVYRNAFGREVIFTISFTEGQTDSLDTIQDSLCVFRPLNPESFFTNLSVIGEYVVFSLIDENDPAYAACFRLSTFDEGEIISRNSLSVFVGQRILTGPTGGGGPIFDFLNLDFLFTRVFSFTDKSAAQNVILLGEEFDNVFEVEWLQNDGITKMYINEDFGMLAFLDENKDLFIFDRYE